MAVFSPTNAKVHFKTYDGSFSDYLGNTTITQNNSVAMSSAQKLFGQGSMYMANANDSITFDTASVFDVGTGDYTVGFWYRPTALASWARIFATDTYQNNKPLRIYVHNGTVSVYAESTTDSTSSHDLMMSYYLGASAVDNWWHILVRRESGTTKLYINGSEEDSSTMAYDIDNSSSPTLGADSTGASGLKGYIQDFFWTEDAVSFTQADFTPATAEPITFHSGNPSISSFSSGGVTSVDNVGDNVTFTWSTSGETKLELLKYIGGILSSTEDVLGLSSKTVTITQTVSYKLRTTNDNGVVDSSSLNISLGGNEMAGMSNVSDGGVGLVLQKGMITGSLNFASQLQVQANSAAAGMASYSGSLNACLIALSGAANTNATNVSAATSGVASVSATTSTAQSGVASNVLTISAAQSGVVSNSTTISTAQSGVVSNSTKISTAQSGVVSNSTKISTAQSGVASNSVGLAAELVARASADTCLSELISEASDAVWTSGTRTLAVGGAKGVRFVFDTYAGVANDAPVSFEVIRSYS